MKSGFVFPLDANETQLNSLHQLQMGFAQVCNAITPVVCETRCWNRVALHHMVYHPLREKYPLMGSQMICNAIYAVSLAARAVYQHPRSPFRADQYAGQGRLPRLHFADSCPVYFDAHTLALGDSRLSLYTMEGRLHFHLGLAHDQVRAFNTKKIRTVVMQRMPEGHYVLHFALETETMSSEQGLEMPPYLAVETKT